MNIRCGQTHCSNLLNGLAPLIPAVPWLEALSYRNLSELGSRRKASSNWDKETSDKIEIY